MNTNKNDNIEDKVQEEVKAEVKITEEIKSVENISPNIDNEEKTIEDMERKKEEIKNLIAKEKLQKKEEKRKKRKKVATVVLKSFSVASCFAILGVGVGAGAVLSKSYVAKREQASFKFDLTDVTQASLKDNIMLTSNSASSIFKEVGDSVVNISTKISGGFFSTDMQDLGSGSGIIYKIDGDKVYILTNNHVIEGASYVTISVTGEEQIEASLIGTDPSSDLGVLMVNKQDMNKAGIENITVAKFADSDSVEVGDFVFPIGNALGRGKTMTQGMISAQNKQINIDGKNLTVIQTDAAINPGNSGGALMNTDGEVVGINTAKLSSSAIEGIGYAIPSNIAIDIADQIITNGYVERPYFGIMGKTISENTKRIYGLETDGVLVVEVEEDSNADKAGLKPGDIIISFNDKNIKTVDDLSVAINNCKPNDTVSFEILREGNKPMTLKVTLKPSNTSF